jgi:hypothetical protein
MPISCGSPRVFATYRRIGGLRRFIPERCTCNASPIGFLFIGRHQPTVSLPVAQLDRYVSPQTCHDLLVDSIGRDAVLVRWCAGWRNLAWPLGFQLSRCGVHDAGWGQNDRKAAEPSHSVPGSTGARSRIFDRVALSGPTHRGLLIPWSTSVTPARLHPDRRLYKPGWRVGPHFAKILGCPSDLVQRRSMPSIRAISGSIRGG